MRKLRATLGGRGGAVAAAAAVLTATCHAPALQISSNYSPRNGSRPRRASTPYIILHTTEGAARGSLRKVRRNGECHYFVNTNGRVYRIIERNRVAFHAGRSMWKGRVNLDNHSIGIEIVGYHNRDITPAQYAAVKELLQQLQRIYGVPDRNVMPHSMVAYGTPNRWHKHSHRGRKRCGMCFAKHSVRSKLGLRSKPAYDPDVRAGRLKVGDPHLAKVLYGTGSSLRPVSAPTTGAAGGNVISAGHSAWDIARDRYRSANTVYELPGGRRLAGNEITDWTAIPAGTKVHLGVPERENVPDGLRVIRDRVSAREIAGVEQADKSTIYFLPDGRVRRGDEIDSSILAELPAGTKVLVGYTQGGSITSRRSAFDICGARWNDASTIYRLPGGIILRGDQVEEGKILRNTQVFFLN